MEQIIVHVQVEPGKFQTLQQHINSQKRSKIEKGTVWLLKRASLIGTNADKWAQAILKARGIPGMGMKQPPKRSGEYLFEIIMRRHETKSTIMTSNRPLEDWGELLGDVPSATAILERFLHHAEIITITGRSYRLEDRAGNDNTKKDKDQKDKDDNDSAHKKSKPD